MDISRNANFQFLLKRTAHKTKFNTQSYKSYFFLKKNPKSHKKNRPLNTPEGKKIVFADVWPMIGLVFCNHFEFRYTFCDFFFV